MILVHSASFSSGRARLGSASWKRSGSSTGRLYTWKSAVRSRLSRSAQSAAPAAGSVAIISRTLSTPPGSETSSQTLRPEYSA